LIDLGNDPPRDPLSELRHEVSGNSGGGQR